MKEYSFKFKVGDILYRGKAKANSKEEATRKFLKKISFSIDGSDIDIDSYLQEDNFLGLLYDAVREKLKGKHGKAVDDFIEYLKAIEADEKKIF